MIVISDTGPLNYLVLIGEEEILHALYARIVVPPEVFGELSRAGAPAVVKAWVSRPPAWLEIVEPVGQADSALMHTRIHAGERQAILLADELKADALLMDDLTGRREAERRRHRVTGTAGVLRAAAREGFIDLKGALDRLGKTNFRLSRNLYDELIAEATRTTWSD